MFSRSLVFATTVFTLLFNSSCSSTPHRYDYPANADVSQEGEILEHDLSMARTQQTDVLSPENYKKSQEKLNHVKSEWAKDHDQTGSLAELGEARYFLDQAMEVTHKAQNEIPQIVQARKAAVTEGAPSSQTEKMKNADQTLLGYTKDLEKGKMKISPDDMSKLEHEYLNAELLAIKSKNLDPSRQKIEAATNMGAEKRAPLTYAETLATYKTSEAAIETDRHNDSIVKPATQKANDGADKLLEVTQNARSGASEAVAVEMFRKSHLIKSQEGVIENKAEENQALNQKNRDLDSKNKDLANGANFNQTLKDAQGMFTNDEAEVYRLGDQILIRLKNIQFPSGKATLSEKSDETMKKVEKVVAMVGAEKVVVEGHTDDIGGAKKNKALSEKRADTVAKVLVKDSAIPAASISTEGFGFDKPLTTNKTKAGRAQNRRVDILITPKSQE